MPIRGKRTLGDEFQPLSYRWRSVLNFNGPPCFLTPCLSKRFKGTERDRRFHPIDRVAARHAVPRWAGRCGNKTWPAARRMALLFPLRPLRHRHAFPSTPEHPAGGNGKLCRCRNQLKIAAFDTFSDTVLEDKRNHRRVTTYGRRLGAAAVLLLLVPKQYTHHAVIVEWLRATGQDVATLWWFDGMYISYLRWLRLLSGVFFANGDRLPTPSTSPAAPPPWASVPSAPPSSIWHPFS